MVRVTVQPGLNRNPLHQATDVDLEVINAKLYFTFCEFADATTDIQNAIYNIHLMEGDFDSFFTVLSIAVKKRAATHPFFRQVGLYLISVAKFLVTFSRSVL